MRTREDILHELAKEQVKLAELERELSGARRKIDALHAELQTASVAKPTALPLTPVIVRKAPATAADKVKLFRSLLRGRTMSSGQSRKAVRPSSSPSEKTIWSIWPIVSTDSSAISSCSAEV